MWGRLRLEQWHRLIDEPTCTEARYFSDRSAGTNAPEGEVPSPDGAKLSFVMSRARNLKFLCSLLAVLALAELAGYLAWWRKRYTSPLALAKAAYGQWIVRPDDARVYRKCYRCVARLVGWFDSLPRARRTEACREKGLAVEMDPMEETGLCRFTAADKVPAHRFRRCHTRAGIGVPVVAWRPNDGSGQWDGLRPPEGIAAPATAILDCGGPVDAALPVTLPLRNRHGPRTHLSAGGKFHRAHGQARPSVRAAAPKRISRHAQFLGRVAS